MIEIICGDSLEVMRGFKDKQFDLVVTDPPYGIKAFATGKMGGVSPQHDLKWNKPHNTKYEPTEWDYEIPRKEYFDEIFRVSKNQIIFGGNYFIEYLKNSPCWIVWDKTGDMTPNNFADCELAWTSFKSPVKKILHRSKGFVRDEIEARLHPTQKPVQVMGWCIADYSEEGQTILDPFAGSGSTGVAAKQIGRDCTLIEISEKYCEIARTRLAQDSLFAIQEPTTEERATTKSIGSL